MRGWLDVLNAAYALDGTDSEWLGRVLDAAWPLMPSSSRAYALTYDARDPTAMKFETVVTRNFPKGKGRHEIEFAHAGLAAADVERAFGRTVCGTASQVLRGEHAEKLRLQTFAPFGVRDSFGVNSIDPTGRGAMLVGLLEETTSASAAMAQGWSRIAAHLAASRRLRQSLGPKLPTDPSKHERVEAILGMNGRVEHAEGEAEHARHQLKSAAIALEGARASKRPTAGLAGWRAMVDARWSLVDHFERDGKRYLVAVRNEAPIEALHDLSLRERQVIGFALLGHANKVIGYELGIATSTVGVLLGRAMKKLGVRSRDEVARLLVNVNND